MDETQRTTRSVEEIRARIEQIREPMLEVENNLKKNAKLRKLFLFPMLPLGLSFMCFLLYVATQEQLIGYFALTSLFFTLISLLFAVIVNTLTYFASLEGVWFIRKRRIIISALKLAIRKLKQNDGINELYKYLDGITAAQAKFRKKDLLYRVKALEWVVTPGKNTLEIDSEDNAE